MGFELTAIEIAAIGAAGLAVIVVLIFIIFPFRRRSANRTRTKSKPKASPNRSDPSGDEPERGWGFGWTSSPSPSPPFAGYPSPRTPSTGSRTPGTSPGSQTKSPATGSTTLVTPASSSSKLKKSAGSPITGRKPKPKAKNPKKKSSKDEAPPSPAPPEILHRPESEEMVMVTYEQGLANMGMVRPHHILRYSEPPPFDEARQAYPVHTPERMYPPDSAEMMRGQRELMTGRSGDSGSGSGSGSDRSRRERDRTRVEPQPQRTAGRRRVDDGRCTWLPSYYRSPESNRRNVDDEESDLGYRTGGGIDGRARYPGWI